MKLLTSRTHYAVQELLKREIKNTNTTSIKEQPNALELEISPINLSLAQKHPHQTPLQKTLHKPLTQSYKPLPANTQQTPTNLSPVKFLFYNSYFFYKYAQ